MRKGFCATVLLLGLYLGLHNGYLALWDSGKDVPERIFPFWADLYPKIDQHALEKGIPIKDEDALKKLLEDFLS